MVTIDGEQIKTVCDYIGTEEQSVIAMEELSELIQAVSKKLRGIDISDNLTEEIADVLIGIEYLKYAYNIKDEAVQSWVNYKQRRTLAWCANDIRNHTTLECVNGDGKRNGSFPWGAEKE